MIYAEKITSPSLKALGAEVPYLACLARKQRDGCLCLLSGQNTPEDIGTVFLGGVTVWFPLGRLHIILIIFHRWPLRTCESSFLMTETNTDTIWLSDKTSVGRRGKIKLE